MIIRSSLSVVRMSVKSNHHYAVVKYDCLVAELLDLWRLLIVVPILLTCVAYDSVGPPEGSSLRCNFLVRISLPVHFSTQFPPLTVDGPAEREPPTQPTAINRLGRTVPDAVLINSARSNESFMPESKNNNRQTNLHRQRVVLFHTEIIIIEAIINNNGAVGNTVCSLRRCVLVFHFDNCSIVSIAEQSATFSVFPFLAVSVISFEIENMSERERSRSPERGAPPADDDDYQGDSNTHQGGGGHHGDDNHGADHNGGGGGGGGDDDEGVKLYVGNLDYGTHKRLLICL